MQSTTIDFRKEAEDRAIKVKQSKQAYDNEANAIQVAAALPRVKPIFKDATQRYESNTIINNSNINNNYNSTAVNAAKLAEVDYRLNGGRARSNTGEFIPPRWIPDEEVHFCSNNNGNPPCLNREFDWVNRKHHCRHCGQIFCDDCSSKKALLPVAFGLRDPQRVCNQCELILRPYQLQLTHTIANHQCSNTIDVEGGACSIRYFNLPYSNDMIGEIRKAAYTIYNLFNVDWVKDKAIPGTLLSNAKGLAFLTVIKGGII